MHFGYPGESTHLEHHGVSEESFWPSFTDIMMVIVMVFLLVTVAVILNNWTLIADLKNSIKAQQIASSLAKNTEKQNHSLEEKLSSLERQVVLLNAKFQTEKTSHLASQQELAKARRILLEKETSLNELETVLSERSANLDTTKTALAQKVQLILALEKRLNSAKQQTDKKIKVEQALLQKLQASEAEQERSQQQLKSLQVSLDKVRASTKQSQAAFEVLQKTQKNLKDKLQLTSATLKELEKQKQQLITTLNQKISQRENELEAKNREYQALKAQQDDKDSKLRSLQGEYTSLDAKYQKLLLPARSVKGKYVVSVLYRKAGGRRIIRLKSSPNGTYVNISESALHKKLKQLKNKYKTDLYLKVVIPQNSGLSYSEAWKFTSALQKKYDYYFQRKSQ